MTEVTPVKSEMQQEQISYRMPVSQNLMQRISANINYLLENSTFLGQCIHLALTEAQFAAMVGFDVMDDEYTKPWVMLKGQSIVGSDYHALTGVSTLPDSLQASGGAFLGQENGEGILAYQSSQNLSHDHTLNRTIFGAGGISVGGTPFVIPVGSQIDSTSPLAMGSNGGASSRPNTIRVNIFMKINL